jgi:ABC-type nitrate/sulfonate/bicarbonate transport system substrate-binding protein
MTVYRVFVAGVVASFVAIGSGRVGAEVVAQAAAKPAVAGSAVKGDGGKIRLLFNQPGTNSFPPFVIRKFQLDKKYGFELQPVPTATTQTMTVAMQSGGAEIGMFGWNDLARIRNAGVKVIGVAPFLRWGADFIVVQKNSPIQTLGDLKGKRVGTGARNALNWIVMRAVILKDDKFDVERESTVQEGAPNLLWGLLENGQLDATHIFNSMTPSMIATGKFRVLAKVSTLVNQFGLPDTPFLLYSADSAYAAAHPENVKAFLAAYRDAIQILMTDDSVWLERGKELQMSEEVASLFRSEARTDLWSKFGPTTETDIRKVFTALLAAAGPEVLGLSALPEGFMTLDYQ